MPGRQKCPPGCQCKKHRVSSATRKRMSETRTGMKLKKCQPGCTCGHHQRTAYKKCDPGCQCKRHQQTEDHRRKNSMANRGRTLSPESVGRRVAARRAKGPYQIPEALTAMHEGLRRALAEGSFRGANYIDGRSAHPHYTRWRNMMVRCFRPDDPQYHNYGGRGITVCAEWHDPWVFFRHLDEFLGPCPPGHSIDRIDNDGHYEPGNVRWADRLGQAGNSRGAWANRRQIP